MTASTRRAVGLCRSVAVAALAARMTVTIAAAPVAAVMPEIMASAGKAREG